MYVTLDSSQMGPRFVDREETKRRKEWRGQESSIKLSRRSRKRRRRRRRSIPGRPYLGQLLRQVSLTGRFMYTEGSRGTLVNAGQPRRIVGEEGGEGTERTIRERSPTRSCLLVHANTRPISRQWDISMTSERYRSPTLHANESFKSIHICLMQKLTLSTRVIIFFWDSIEEY